MFRAALDAETTGRELSHGAGAAGPSAVLPDLGRRAFLQGHPSAGSCSLPAGPHSSGAVLLRPAPRAQKPRDRAPVLAQVMQSLLTRRQEGWAGASRPLEVTLKMLLGRTGVLQLPEGARVCE